MKRISVIICLVFVASCSPSRFVKPLNKNQHAANVSFGGPLIVYGTSTIPLPFLTANYGYGVDSTLTVFSSLNITAALYGNLQMELGLTKQLLKQNKLLPALSITPQFNFIYRDKNAAKFYPQLDANLFWEYGKRRNYFYLGVSNWFELAQTRTLDTPQKHHWYFVPLLGHSFTGKKWNVNLEAKVMAPNLSNKDIVVEYVTPLKSHGAFGVYIGYTRKF